jgi:hypothetical protein
MNNLCVLAHEIVSKILFYHVLSHVGYLMNNKKANFTLISEHKILDLLNTRQRLGSQSGNYNAGYFHIIRK